MMKPTLWQQAGLLGSMAAVLTSCAQPVTDQTFTVQKIDARPGRRDGAVRIKLTTPGDYAEADESLVVQYAQVVAVREATTRQRQIAAERARATYKKIAMHPTVHPRKARYLAVKTEPSAPSPTTASASAPRSKVVSRAAANVPARASIMIWDTHTQEIVGNKVYDVGSEPSSGSVTRFETYTAEYVGSGL